MLAGKVEKEVDKRRPHISDIFHEGRIEQPPSDERVRVLMPGYDNVPCPVPGCVGTVHQLHGKKGYQCGECGKKLPSNYYVRKRAPVPTSLVPD